MNADARGTVSAAQLSSKMYHQESERSAGVICCVKHCNRGAKADDARGSRLL